MTVKFLVDPDALHGDCNDLAKSQADHLRLFQEWKKYGVMVLPSNHDEIDAKINQMRTKDRKLWQMAMTNDRFRKVEFEDDTCTKMLSDIDAIGKADKVVDLICLDRTRGFCFGISEEDISITTQNGIELCRYDCSDQSLSFGEQRALWNRLIFSGSSVDAIWQDRFFGLTHYGKVISIVDRYCLKNALKKFSAGESSELDLALKLINSFGGRKKKSINLYASNNDIDERSARFCIERICARFKSSNIASFHLHICPDAVFSEGRS